MMGLDVAVAVGGLSRFCGQGGFILLLAAALATHPLRVLS